MSESEKPYNRDLLVQTVSAWLKRRLNEENFNKLLTATEEIRSNTEDWIFYSSFSAAPRHSGKQPLSLGESEKKEAETLRSGWKPWKWSLDELSRLFILLSVADQPKEEFLNRLEKLFVSSDMGEAVALYKSLPVLPWPKELRERTSEGIRSNITHVFNAIAHHNPYPADYLEDPAWNQLILKALFVESPLWPIQGIDRRANAELARMLIEYAHERRAAGRTFSPELWRPVGPFIRTEWISDFEKALSSDNPLHRQAAALSLSMSDLPEAKKLLETHEKLSKEVAGKQISWEAIGKQINPLK